MRINAQDLKRRPTYCCFGILLAFAFAGCATSNQSVVDLPTRLAKAKAYSNSTSGDALLVWMDGSLVLEDFATGYDPETPHLLAEASMLLSGLAALAAVDDGLFALDDPVSNTITEWGDDPEKSKITISDLLHHASGLDSVKGGSTRVLAFESALNASTVNRPGEVFSYGPTSYQVFGALLQRVTGSFGWLRSRIFEPLDIPGGRWLAVNDEMAEQNQSGIAALSPRLFDGANLTAHELGRIGQLILQEGRWNGGQIIEDLRPLTDPESSHLGFGLGVWHNVDVRDSVADRSSEDFRNHLPDGIISTYGQERLIYDRAPADLFVAAGRYNQRLFVIPSEKLVVVRLGRQNESWSDTVFLGLLFDGKVPIQSF